jgi:type II secretory pathway pseudopilin PulG
MFRKLNNKGFTIVETLIVLAIAATIIIVVLLAVPALQRQSRNTATKVGAGAIASGWTAEVGNANGATITVTTGAGAIYINTASYKVNAAITTFTATAVAATVVTYSSTNSVTGAAGDKLTNNSIALYISGVCPATTTGTSITPTVGTATQAAIVYSIEPGTLGCIQG